MFINQSSVLKSSAWRRGGEGAGPDKSHFYGLLLMIRLLDRDHQPHRLMGITPDEKLGHMWVGSPRGLLFEIAQKHTPNQDILIITPEADTRIDLN